MGAASATCVGALKLPGTPSHVRAVRHAVFAATSDALLAVDLHTLKQAVVYACEEGEGISALTVSPGGSRMMVGTRGG